MTQLKKNIFSKYPSLMWIIATAIMTALVASFICLSLTKAPINMDSYYYIGASRFLMEGKVPFLDFPPGYTPLSFYIMCIPFSIFGVSFQAGLATLFFIHIINAFLVFVLCGRYTHNKWIAAFIAVFSLLLCLNHDGSYYILEPFVLCFGLMALVVLNKETKWRLFLSGFLCFCAFWCKQYGLGFICLAMVQLVLKNSFGKQLIGKCLYLWLGFIAGLVVAVVLLWIQGVNPLQLTSLSGSDYAREGVHSLFYGWFSLFISLPLLVVPIALMMLKLRRVKQNPLLVVSFLGIFGFMLQCYVRLYAHYLILVMPFCTLMLFAGIEAIQSVRWKKIYQFFLFLTPVIPCYFMIKGDMSLLRSHEKATQMEYAETVKKIIPEGSDSVFTSSDMHSVMLLNVYNPPMINKYGLSNGFVTNPDEVGEMIRNSAYCVISDQSLRSERFSQATCDYLTRGFDRKTYPLDIAGGKYHIFLRKD